LRAAITLDQEIPGFFCNRRDCGSEALDERFKRVHDAARPAAACIDHALIRRVLRHFIPAAPADILIRRSPPNHGAVAIHLIDR